MASATQRTDCHRPSALVVADYEYVAIEHEPIPAFGFCLSVAQWVQEQRRRIAAHFERTGGTYSDHDHGGNCHVCGAHCIRTALFYHAKTNTYIRTGFDCAEKMSMGDPQAFRICRKTIEEARKLKAGKAKAAAILAEHGLDKAWELYLVLEDVSQWVAFKGLSQNFNQDTDRGVLADFAEECGMEIQMLLRSTSQAPESRQKQERTLVDIVGKLVQYGSLSEGQLKYLHTLLRQIEERPARDAKYAAEKAAADDVPEGRHTIKAEVLKTEERDGPYGVQLKMLVKAEAGYTLWSTVPSAIGRIPVNSGEEFVQYRQLERGDKIELTGTFKRSDGDAKFGFVSRPYGRLIPAQPVVTEHDWPA